WRGGESALARQHGVEDAADDRDDERREERPPEAVDEQPPVGEAREPAREHEHERVDDEEEQAEGEDRQRQREELGDRLDDEVDEREDEADDADDEHLVPALRLGEGHPVEEQGGEPDGHGADDEPDEEAHAAMVPRQDRRRECDHGGMAPAFRFRSDIDSLPAYVPG